MLKHIGVGLLVAVIATVGWIQEVPLREGWGPIVGLLLGVAVTVLLAANARRRSTPPTEGT